MSNQVTRTLTAIEELAGHEVLGLSRAELAKAIKCQSGEAGRVLATLQEKKWVELVPNTDDRYRLTAKIGQISQAIYDNFSSMQRALVKDQVAYSQKLMG